MGRGELHDDSTSEGRELRSPPLTRPLPAIRGDGTRVDGPQGEGPEPSRAIDIVANDRPIVVRDRCGAILFEHVPGSGKTVVHVPAGDLEIRASGRIDLVAGQTVALAAERSVEITTGSMTLDADRARARIDEAELVARLVSTAAEASRVAVSLLDVRADRIVESTRVALREATELAESRAGRVRQIATSAFHIVADRAIVRAAETLKLRGKKIHLA